jgi:hypothetical protein
LAAQFQQGADYERDKGYNNVKGKRLFSAFLCDLLERAEAAQDTLGLHAETLRWATQHARDYGQLRPPQRMTLLVRRLRARTRCVAIRRLTCHPGRLRRSSVGSSWALRTSRPCRRRTWTCRPRGQRPPRPHLHAQLRRHRRHRGAPARCRLQAAQPGRGWR